MFILHNNSSFDSNAHLECLNAVVGVPKAFCCFSVVCCFFGLEKILNKFEWFPRQTPETNYQIK